jgi:phage gp45-like
MMFDGANLITRARLTALRDDGETQVMDLVGHKGETFTGVPRQQTHGFSSHPPADAVGTFLRMGESDRLLALGYETPGRPRSLPAGATALYNADGSVWKLLGTKADLDQGGKPMVTRNTPKYRVKAGEFAHIEIEPGGGVYLGKGPPWHPVVTTAGPSNHVFAGIDPPASNVPSEF